MEHSLYERQSKSRQDRDFGIAFGRITRVFPEERLCEVKTFMGNGQREDNSLPGCQWINMDANPDGDESTNIPRVNSYGLVFFIGGEPFIFGFFSPLTGTGSASINTDDKEQLNEGDRIMKTVGKNKIILRAHGEIEIQSTNVCRTIYFPDQNLINTLCRNYEFRTDGGTIDWLNLEDSGNTLSTSEWRTDIKRTNVIIEDKGYVDGEEIIWRTRIGAGTPDGITQPVWEETVLRTGETTLFIHAPGAATGYKLNIKPDGTTKLEIAGKMSAEIKASGETTIDVGPGKATLNIKPSGDTSFVTKGKIDVTSDGPVNVTTKGSMTAKVTGPVMVDCAKATVTAKANTLKGGAVTDNVINNDPITGIPLKGVGGVDLV